MTGVGDREIEPSERTAESAARNTDCSKAERVAASRREEARS
mgnify:CR=1 FL=1